MGKGSRQYILAQYKVEFCTNLYQMRPKHVFLGGREVFVWWLNIRLIREIYVLDEDVKPDGPQDPILF